MPLYFAALAPAHVNGRRAAFQIEVKTVLN